MLHKESCYSLYLFVWCDGYNLTFQNVQSPKFKILMCVYSRKRGGWCDVTDKS